MDGTKQCRLCKETLPLPQFETLKTSAKRPYLHATCRECRTEQSRLRCNATPDAFIRRAVSQLRCSRRKRNPDLKFVITPEEVIDLFNAQDGKCALSGIDLTYMRDGKGTKFPYNISIDRIDPKGDYVIENIQLVAAAINLMKGTWSDYTFIETCIKVASHMLSPQGKRIRARAIATSGDGSGTGWCPPIAN